MNRSISLSEHHARRRKARTLRERDGSSSSSNSGGSSRSCNSEHSGVAHDAACFGAHEARSSRGGSSRGSRGRMDAEHASYAAEACIGYESERMSNKKRGVVSPARSSFSSPDLDIEDVSRYDTCARSQGTTSRYSQRLGGTASYASSVYSQNSRSGAGGTKSRTSYPSASDDSFVSVDVGYDSATRFDGSTIATNSILEDGGGVPISPRSEEEDAIRAGIVDISTFIATWLAGCLSFVIGKFWYISYVPRVPCPEPCRL